MLIPPIAMRGLFVFCRGRKLNANYFFSNFSGTAGISQQNPGISRQNSLISPVSRDIPNFLAPTHSRGGPPPHPKVSGPKSLGLGSFFFRDYDGSGLPQGPFQRTISTPLEKVRADFRAGDEDSNFFQFSESGGSVNGPKLFAELPCL